MSYLTSEILQQLKPDAQSNNWDIQFIPPQELASRLVPNPLNPMPNLELSIRASDCSLHFPTTEFASITYKTWTVEHQVPFFSNSAISFSVTLLIDAYFEVYRFFLDWRNLYQNLKTGSALSYIPPELRGKIIVCYNTHNRRIGKQQKWVLNGVWVNDIKEIQFARDNAQPLSVQIEFKALTIQLED